MNLDFYQTKYLKYKKKYINLKNQVGGECDPLPTISDAESQHLLIEKRPEERITIREKCFDVALLHNWIITENHDNLPGIERVITAKERKKLVDAYMVLINFNIPQYIMNRTDIISLISKNPTEITEIFNNNKNLSLYNRPDNIESYKNFTIEMHMKLIGEIKLFQHRNPDIPITLVTVGNTSYKLIRLIELFSDIKNINYIYLPYSKHFYDKRCSCNVINYFNNELIKNPKIKDNIFPPDRDRSRCTIIDTNIGDNTYSLCHWNNCNLLIDEERAPIEYLELYLSNPEEFLNKQYNPIQQQYFENMLINSGLKKNIDDNHKIILIDFLEQGTGFLSFLMTIDKYLQKDNTFIIGLESETNPFSERYQSILINNGLILNKYEIKYLKLYLDGLNYIVLLADDISLDRCVKSYPKKNWIENYTNYSEENINNCNITLLNMALILKNNGIIDV